MFMFEVELGVLGFRDFLEVVSGKMNSLSILIFGGEMKGLVMKFFFYVVYFFIYGYFKIFIIREGGCYM